MENVNNKNTNFEMEERVRILELTNYFLRIKDSYFMEDFEKKANSFLENAVDALEFEDESLDYEFYQACSRIEDMYKGREITKKEKTFLFVVKALESLYSKSKINYYD